MRLGDQEIQRGVSSRRFAVRIVVSARQGSVEPAHGARAASDDAPMGPDFAEYGLA